VTNISSGFFANSSGWAWPSARGGAQAPGPAVGGFTIGQPRRAQSLMPPLT
jgi:hypothetical protein